MEQHLLCCDALLRIQRQRLHEEIYAVGSYGAEAHFIPVLSVNGVLSRDGIFGQFRDAGPVIVCGGTDGFANHLDLVEFVVAREKRRTHH